MAHRSRQNDARNTHLSARRRSVAICWQRGAKFAVLGLRGHAFVRAPQWWRPVLRVYANGEVASFRLLAKRRDMGHGARDTTKRGADHGANGIVAG